MSNSENTKRIAKNTILLYFRMFLTMGVSLYTSRVVLNTLGVADFGIYNVVGGVVMMLSFLNTAMSSATQRFLSFELGRKDHEQLKRIFSMSVNIHALIAIIILILAESIGLWFLNTQLNIPDDRMGAANFVYQFSVFSFIISILSVPYNATIIAHERMNAYAFLSLFEVTLKLLVVFVLVLISFDKLKLYALLVFFVSIIVRVLYQIYCKVNFSESKYKFYWDQSLYKTLLSYAGWNLFGNIAVVSFNQGINILLNIFFGPTINAARGIAYQVNAAINGFVSNFQMAMNPQIIKSFAADETEYMHQLIYQGAKYSFFLMIIISLPILLEIEVILALWLKTVPAYTALFCRLVLINAMIDCISGPLITSAQASGKIKKYQTIVGGLLLLILPISFIFLKKGSAPQITFYISIFISIVALFTRLLILQPLINISIRKFIYEVILKILFVVCFASIIPILIRFYMEDTSLRLILTMISSILCTIISIYIIGLKNKEKEILKIQLANYLKF